MKEGWSESEFYRFCMFYLGYIRGYLIDTQGIQTRKMAAL